jgi:anti-sigma factor ChrR (cupin superfamily)
MPNAMKDVLRKRVDAQEAAIRKVIEKLAASNAKWKQSDVDEVTAILDAGT